jgi:hypothetical protein
MIPLHMAGAYLNKGQCTRKENNDETILELGNET